MMSELKPCPFCGGKAIIKAHQCAEDQMSVFIECGSCLTAGDVYEDAYAPTQQAIDAWNTRTPDPRVMKLVEALKGCIDAYDFCSDDPADRGWSVLDGAVADARTALSAFNGDGK